MSYIDELIHTKKSIIKEQKKDMDIVYITPRVLAMSYPC